jgi:hypothetical protein
MENSDMQQKFEAWAGIKAVLLLLSFLLVGLLFLKLNELRPPPKITAIPQDDPSVVAFKKFAEDRKLRWEIEPDDVDGTSYCALLLKETYVVVSVGCRSTLRDATNRAIGLYELKKLGIGSNWRALD